MPATTYMGVDARRDHSMRIPRPDLSVMAGTPNACTMCHADKSAEWALNALLVRGVAFRDTARHPAVAMARVARGDARGVPRLVDLARSPQTAPIWRATALERTAATGDRDALALALEFLSADEPLLRVSAVRALAALPADQRFRYLAPLAHDAVAGVRLEVAQQLADVPLEQLRPEDRQWILALFGELRDVHREHADMPSMNMQAGVFHQARGDFPAAEAAYREALYLNPQLASASLNLADLLRVSGRDDEARAMLESALGAAPENADAIHALGLLEIRAGNRDRALDLLRQAALAPDASARHRYVYAIALHDTGDVDGALQVLQELHRDLPADQEALLALTNYSAEAGESAAARGYAQKLMRLDPDNPQYRRLGAMLERR
jgi:tetratricopeptide (TPR) repeat protein